MSSTSAPSTDWREQIAPDEAQRLEAHAQVFAALQQKRAARGGAPRRALHAKGLCGARAELTVLPDLPEAARVGIFAAPRSYRAWVRFSNGSSGAQPDRRPDVRGLAVKILGVPGKKLIPALAAAQTQDLLMINAASTPFRGPDEFVAFARAASSPALLLPRLIGALGFGRSLQILRRLLAGTGKPVASLATTRFYSALPIQWGRGAVHYGAIPVDAAPAASSPPAGDEHLRDDLIARLAAGPLRYDLQIQFFVDEARTPIEDASIEWREDVSPFVTIARLVIPRQDLRSVAGQEAAAFVEGLSFDPWHAPEEFRPLGAMMRARDHAYRVSTMGRGAAPEPGESDGPPLR